MEVVIVHVLPTHNEDDTHVTVAIRPSSSFVYQKTVEMCCTVCIKCTCGHASGTDTFLLCGVAWAHKTRVSSKNNISNSVYNVMECY